MYPRYLGVINKSKSMTVLRISDAPIPLFTNRSDTDIFCFEIGRYLADTDTLPQRNYLH